MSEYEKWHRMAKVNKELYPKGTRIKLNEMDDPYHPVPPGTKGTVRFVDDSGQIFMKWDNGRTLPLNSEIDDFRLLTADEIAQEQSNAETEDFGMTM